jgi:hypothetical protein
MFDLIGGFVVKVLPAESLDRLRATLTGLAFDYVALEAARIRDKASLTG